MMKSSRLRRNECRRHERRLEANNEEREEEKPVVVNGPEGRFDALKNQRMERELVRIQGGAVLPWPAARAGRSGERAQPQALLACRSTGLGWQAWYRSKPRKDLVAVWFRVHFTSRQSDDSFPHCTLYADIDTLVCASDLHDKRLLCHQRAHRQASPRGFLLQIRPRIEAEVVPHELCPKIPLTGVHSKTWHSSSRAPRSRP